MAQLCYKCFNEYESGVICPHCGYDAGEDAGKYPHALKPGSILGGRYIVGRVLGQGGFGITYMAQDYDTKQIVAIKEFFPMSIATRVDGLGLSPISARSGEYFDFGKEKFVAEAQTLSQFNGLEGICDIYSYFEENGTAYFAMEYVEGKTFAKYIEIHGGALGINDARRILLPLMDTLDAVHAKGIIHRDIAPDNIIMKRDGTAVLIDFGAARYSTGEKTQNITAIYKNGFAPIEQYSARSRQGAYTDVYAMAATCYYAITGKMPPDAIDRPGDDRIVSLSDMGIHIWDVSEFDRVLMKGLAVNAAERWQTMGEFAAALRSARFLSQAEKEAEDRKKKQGFFSSTLSAFKHTKKGAEETKPAKILSGMASDSVRWEYDRENATFSFSGTGPMDDHSLGEELGEDWDEAVSNAKKLVVSEGITHIGDYAFMTSCFERVHLPESLESIGKSAFYTNTHFREIKLPKRLRTIGSNAFSFCEFLEEIRLPEQLEAVPNGAFSNCGYLEFADLCAVGTIGKQAFYKCESLRMIKLSPNLKTIERSAFCGCSGLEIISFQGSDDDWRNIRIEGDNEPLLKARIVFYGCADAEAELHNGVENAGDAKQISPELKAGMKLCERFIVEQMLDRDGMNITYKARDTESGAPVLVREYMPLYIACRAPGFVLKPASECYEEKYARYRKLFLCEAKALTELDMLKGICNVYGYFEENGTAYYVTEYIEGVNLREYMEYRGGVLSVQEAGWILQPIMRDMQLAHDSGILHRKIEPYNIIIANDGRSVITNFSAVQSAMDAEMHIDGIHSFIYWDPFQPIENYAIRKNKGPFSDVYSMAAVYYYAITGQVPKDGYQRSVGEELLRPSDLGCDISAETEAVLMKAMEIEPKDRWQSMEEFLQALTR